MADKTIVIVDDTAANIAAALAILKDQYRIRVATLLVRRSRSLPQAAQGEGVRRLPRRSDSASWREAGQGCTGR